MERRQTEQGSILVLTAILLVALMLVIGLVIDASNLYRARVAMQNAADAASLATINYVTTEGKIHLEEQLGVIGQDTTSVKTAFNTYLEPRARKIALANIAKSGFPNIADGAHTVQVSGDYRPAGDPLASNQSAYEYQVSVSRRIDYWVMGYLPFTSVRNQLVRATAVSRRQIANVSLILDVSRSMACPAEGDCTCLTPARTGPCASPSKMDKLLDALQRFLQLFDPEHDRIGLIPFNITSRPETMEEIKQAVAAESGHDIPYYSSAVIEEFINHIRDTFIVSSVTNVCDGFMSARQQMRATLGAGTQNIAYVFFSDGAPTAGRFLFTSPKPALAPWSKGFGQYDYTHTSVEWVDDDNNYRSGPSLLVQTGLFPFGWGEVAFPPADQQDDPHAKVADCNTPAGTPVLAGPPSISRDEDVPAAAEAVFAPCLRSLEAHMPGQGGDSASYYGGNYLPGLASDPGFKSWAEQYFNCGIQLADFMRNEGGTFYVIGLGEKNAASDPNDPYEGVFDTNSRHDHWLSRIALDPTMDTGTTEFTYAGYKTSAQAAQLHPSQIGEYAPAPNAAELDVMFQRIALRVLLRLVS
jgi:hypothetical protein